MLADRLFFGLARKLQQAFIAETSLMKLSTWVAAKECFANAAFVDHAKWVDNQMMSLKSMHHSTLGFNFLSPRGALDACETRRTPQWTPWTNRLLLEVWSCHEKCLACFLHVFLCEEVLHTLTLANDLGRAKEPQMLQLPTTLRTRKSPKSLASG